MKLGLLQQSVPVPGWQPFGETDHGREDLGTGTCQAPRYLPAYLTYCVSVRLLLDLQSLQGFIGEDHLLPALVRCFQSR